MKGALGLWLRVMAWSIAPHSSKIGDGFVVSWSLKTGDGVIASHSSNDGFIVSWSSKTGDGVNTLYLEQII